MLCTLTLQGYPSESEQIWNSTGLTLWPCSQYLCDYLCHNLHHKIILGRDILDGTNNNNIKRNNNNKDSCITVVELGSGLGRCGLLVHYLLRRLVCDDNNKNNHTATPKTRIYLTDGDTDTLRQLRANVVANTTTIDQHL